MNEARRWRLTGWEITLIALIALAVAWSARLSPYYLSLDQIAYSTRQFIIPGLLALGLMIVVTTGEIDISVASTLAVASVALSKGSAFGLPVALAAPLAVAIGAALGALNGGLVAALRLPSLAVTLGAMGAYRGLAFIVGSEVGYTNFNDSYLYVGSEQTLGGIVPVSFLLFVAAALAVGFLMHGTVFGRRCFAVGNNADAAWIAGVDVRRLKIVAFALAGALAGLAGLVWVGQYGSARGDNADGMILLVVTAVVLGGVDINGGRGTVLGVGLALLLLGTLRNGMGLANIAGPTQTVVFGSLLLIGVLRPFAAGGASRWRRRPPKPFTGKEDDDDTGLDKPAKSKTEPTQTTRRNAL
jgi:rhamnose transport system permease protein